MFKAIDPLIMSLNLILSSMVGNIVFRSNLELHIKILWFLYSLVVLILSALFMYLSQEEYQV